MLCKIWSAGHTGAGDVMQQGVLGRGWAEAELALRIPGSAGVGLGVVS